MITREALEHYENDPNPFAVDPRLTETVPSAPVGNGLQYENRVTWEMINKKAFFAVMAALFAAIFVQSMVMICLGPFSSASLFKLALFSLFIAFLSIELFMTKRSLQVDARSVEISWYIRGIRFRTRRYDAEQVKIKPVKGSGYYKCGVLFQVSWFRGFFFPCKDNDELDRMTREINDYLAEQW